MICENIRSVTLRTEHGGNGLYIYGMDFGTFIIGMAFEVMYRHGFRTLVRNAILLISDYL